MTSAPRDHKKGGDPAAELQAALGTAVLGEGAAYSRLIGRGPDLLGLLQRLSTGDVAKLVPGEGRATVLTTNKGRIVQRLFVFHLGPQGVLLLAGPDGAGIVLDHLKRYTFNEDTGLADATDSTALCTLTGPRASRVLEGLGVEAPPPLGSREARIAGAETHVLGTSGDSAEGFAILCPAGAGVAVSNTVRAAVVTAGGNSAGPAALEAARVLRGVGAHHHELTERYNPLEAGQRDAVSFTKGCYVGQEVVARLENYDKVSRTLVGIEFAADLAPPPPDTPLLRDGREVGRVTSALVPPAFDRGVGLASIKHRDTAIGDTLVAGETDAAIRLVALPFPEAGGDRP